MPHTEDIIREARKRHKDRKKQFNKGVRTFEAGQERMPPPHYREHGRKQLAWLAGYDSAAGYEGK